MRSFWREFNWQTLTLFMLLLFKETQNSPSTFYGEDTNFNNVGHAQSDGGGGGSKFTHFLLKVLARDLVFLRGCGLSLWTALVT